MSPILNTPTARPAPSYLFLPPPTPAYTIPTEADCDWIVEGGRAYSQRGLLQISADIDGDVVGHCVRASHLADPAHKRTTIGIRGNGGTIAIGGQYNPHSGRSVTRRNPITGEYHELDVQVLGLNPQAEAVVAWGGQWGFTKRFALFNLGMRGVDDSFIVRANNPCGDIILHGHWLLPKLSFTHASGIHAANWRSMVISDMAHKGAMFREHALYLKSGGPVWVQNCNLRGGNRTGMQIRPGRDESYLSAGTGNVVISGNYAADFGSEHSVPEGGSFISVWSNPNNRTYIVNNRTTNARYGCLMVGAQGVERNWLNARNFPIGEVFIDGNEFENLNGDRHTVAVSGVERVVFGQNTIEGRGVVLDNQWAMQSHGIKNGTVQFATPPTFVPVSWSVSGDEHREWSAAEVIAATMDPTMPTIPTLPTDPGELEHEFVNPTAEAAYDDLLAQAQEEQLPAGTYPTLTHQQIAEALDHTALEVRTMAEEAASNEMAAMEAEHREALEAAAQSAIASNREAYQRGVNSVAPCPPTDPTVPDKEPLPTKPKPVPVPVPTKPVPVPTKPAPDASPAVRLAHLLTDNVLPRMQCKDDYLTIQALAQQILDANAP